MKFVFAFLCLFWKTSFPGVFEGFFKNLQKTLGFCVFLGCAECVGFVDETKTTKDLQKEACSNVATPSPKTKKAKRTNQVATMHSKTQKNNPVATMYPKTKKKQKNNPVATIISAELFFLFFFGLACLCFHPQTFANCLLIPEILFHIRTSFL